MDCQIETTTVTFKVRIPYFFIGKPANKVYDRVKVIVNTTFKSLNSIRIEQEKKRFGRGSIVIAGVNVPIREYESLITSLSKAKL